MEQLEQLAKWISDNQQSALIAAILCVFGALLLFVWAAREFAVWFLGTRGLRAEVRGLRAEIQILSEELRRSLKASVSEPSAQGDLSSVSDEDANRLPKASLAARSDVNPKATPVPPVSSLPVSSLPVSSLSASPKSASLKSVPRTTLPEDYRESVDIASRSAAFPLAGRNVDSKFPIRPS